MLPLAQFQDPRVPIAMEPKSSIRGRTTSLAEGYAWIGLGHLHVNLTARTTTLNEQALLELSSQHYQILRQLTTKYLDGVIVIAPHC